MSASTAPASVKPESHPFTPNVSTAEKAQAGACPFPLRSALTHPCGTWSAHGTVRTWPFTRSLRHHVGRERQQ